jgi:hypothetical protein
MDFMSKCFVVLGMHRSATSLVTKGLFKTKVHIGSNILSPDSGNPHGYWEDTHWLNLNKKILALAGGDWYFVPDEDAILKVGERADIKGEIKQLVDERKRYDLWGFKDPRTTLTIRVILPYLENPHFIVCFRSPLEIAKSLYRRNPKIGDMAQHLKVAKTYNQRLLSFLQEIVSQNDWSMFCENSQS